jgi:hypothetical protein
MSKAENQILLSIRRFYTKVFANETLNPSAKVVELINAGEHGEAKELVTRANDALYRPLAMAIYGGASLEDVNVFIASSTAEFNHWMDAAKFAAKGKNKDISIDKMSKEQLIALKSEIEKMLEPKQKIDEDDFS